MANSDPKRSPPPVPTPPLPHPLDDRVWAVVVEKLDLTPQQERVVKLLMQSSGDKHIARELGMAFPTVRTHMSRIFERAGVEDRMQLVHLIYAVAIEAWSHDHLHGRRHQD